MTSILIPKYIYIDQAVHLDLITSAKGSYHHREENQSSKRNAESQVISSQHPFGRK